MLANLRNIVRSKLAGLFIGILILSLAAWGVSDVFLNNMGQDIAKAGKRGFTLSEFDSDVTNRIRRAGQESGEYITMQQLAKSGQLMAIFNTNSSRLVRAAHADMMGIEASAQSVAKQIRDIGAFQNPVTGEYDRDTYIAVLASNGYTQAEFQENLRLDNTLYGLDRAIEAGIRLPDIMTDIQTRYNTETREIAVIGISQDNIPLPNKPEGDILEEALNAYFVQNISKYSEPERRRLSIFSLSIDDYRHQYTPSEEELRAEYEVLPGRYAEPSTLHYIQYSLSSEVEANTVFDRLVTNVTLNNVMDGLPGGVQSDLKLRSDEIEDSPFKDRLSNLLEGGTSPALEYNGKWMVFKFIDTIPGLPRSFEQVREEILERLVLDRAQSTYYEQLDILNDYIGAGSSLKEISMAMGAPVLQLPPVDQTMTTVEGSFLTQIYPDFPDVLEAMNSLFVGEVSERFDTQDRDRIYLVQLDEIIAPTTPEFADVYDQLYSDYEAERLQNTLNEFIESLRDRLEQDPKSIDKEAAQIGVEVIRPPNAMERSMVQDAFNISPGKSAFIISSTPDASIKYVGVVEVVNLAGEDEISRQRTQTRTTLDMQIAEDLFEAVNADIQSQIELRVNNEQLDIYISGLTEGQ